MRCLRLFIRLPCSGKQVRQKRTLQRCHFPLPCSRAFHSLRRSRTKQYFALCPWKLSPCLLHFRFFRIDAPAVLRFLRTEKFPSHVPCRCGERCPVLGNFQVFLHQHLVKIGKSSSLSSEPFVSHYHLFLLRLSRLEKTSGSGTAGLIIAAAFLHQHDVLTELCFFFPFFRRHTALCQPVLHIKPEQSVQYGTNRNKNNHAGNPHQVAAHGNGHQYPDRRPIEPPTT